MRRPSGFTIIEVLLALVIGAIVVAGAHRVFAGVMDGVQRTADARIALDREANARRLLATLVAGIETGGAPADGFQGEPHRVAFSTWQRDGAGHAVRQRVRIEAEQGALVAYGIRPEPVPLLHDVTALALDYLLETGAAERFVSEWRSDASAPVAMRLRIARGAGTDTLLLIVGPRG